METTAVLYSISAILSWSTFSNAFSFEQETLSNISRIDGLLDRMASRKRLSSAHISEV